MATVPESAKDIGVLPGSGPVFFWQPWDVPHGWLSQWYDAPFEVDGVRYLTTEMWMMVQKARLFGDEETAAKMLKSTSPKEHKKLGREVKGFDGRIWNEKKLDIVKEGNKWKFTISRDHKALQQLLLDTLGRELVEASPEDRIWGIGFIPQDAEENRDKWGENLLGKAITAVRDGISRGKDRPTI